MAKDYYQTLGVGRDASEKDIKRAFRRLAKENHPDANPDDPQAETRFKAINEAYSVLSNPEKRAQYDRFGPDFERFQQGAPGGGYGSGFGGAAGGPGGGYYEYVDMGNMDDSPFADILDSLFGGFGGRARPGAGPGYAGTQAGPQPGRDLEHPVTISLREAYNGTTRYITKGERRIKVNIPPGADNGTKVSLSGEGEPGMMGAPAGNLYLIVTVEPDADFTREGDDLTVDVRVDMFTAMLGGEVRVPTMAREVKLKVPPGTQSGRKFRLSGKGMPRRRQKGEYGDLYARVLITVPEHLTPAQREQVEHLRRQFPAG